jgi:hypothetical protein
MQLLDSSGSVVADNEGTADQIAAYEELTSSDGLKTEAGDYYVKVSFGSVALKSKAQNYNVSLYSGTVFSSSYQTTASSQTKTGQRVLVDETLTFAASDARKYGKETILPLNTSIDSPTNIGWLYENRGALSLKSKLSPMSSEAYYNFVLQKGDSLKMSFNNRTGTSDLRVQLLDPTGTRVYADSDGTEEQKEAYDALTSSTGLSAKTGSYIVKVTYAKTADRTKEQAYDVKLYSGEHYTSLYETTAAVEDYETAVLNGHWEAKYSPETAVASYLQSALQGDGVDIMETIKSTV